MARLCFLFVLPLLLLTVIAMAADKSKAKPKEIVDLAEAQADPDFAVQGEYLLPGKFKLGAQVIALGKGQFDVVIYTGGLPGEGGKRGDKQISVQATREGNVTTLTGKNLTGTVADGAMRLTPTDGAQPASLKRIERKSPTLGAKPPAGANVLFNGSSAEKFDHPEHVTKEKTLDGEVTTKDKFGDYSLHLEFRLSWMPDARGQARSNSGIYLHDCYEVQILDSFGLEGADNECGGIYKVKGPGVNMCYPPMTWQTYDIDFTAPKYEGKKKVANARLTLRHNGVEIQKDLELPKSTPGRQKEGPGPRPLYLQGHGNHVQFRNVWLVEKK
jgi:hypothetical protein